MSSSQAIAGSVRDRGEQTNNLHACKGATRLKGQGNCGATTAAISGSPKFTGSALRWTIGAYKFVAESGRFVGSAPPRAYAHWKLAAVAWRRVSNHDARNSP